jgi:hypothetical protein
MLSKRDFAIHYDRQIMERVNTIKNDTHYRESKPGWRSLEKLIDLHSSPALLGQFVQIALDLQTILKTILRENQYHVVSIKKISFAAKYLINLVTNQIKHATWLKIDALQNARDN